MTLSPASFHVERLEASELVQRRTKDTITTHTEAGLRAIWYLDENFKPRYWMKEESRDAKDNV